MASGGLVQPVVREGPQPSFVKSVFFKKLLDVRLGTATEGLVERGSQSLACSNKFGVMVLGGQEGGVVVVRPDDILAVQRMASVSKKTSLTLKDIPHLKVKNPAFSSPPCCIAISQGDEFIAMDTDRGGTPILLVFKLREFLVNKGNIRPHCEVRASSRAGSKVSDIIWNPGENMGNIVAINCEDGALQLATIKGENSVELFSYKEGGVRCMCWSPKGKQLVVGKNNGNFSQLKLDLSEAKAIAGPGGGLIPGAIHWTSTTQFLVMCIVADADIDLMQLDLAKGSPPTYSSYGDIFVSDKISGFSKCFFVGIPAWNLLVCPSNTINDVPVLMKGLDEGNKENWIVAEIDDNRRGAFPIDNYCVGVALYTGWKQPTVFSDVESFGPMPYVFGLSNEGILSSAAVVNSDPNAPCVVVDVPEKLKPDVLFRKESGSGDAKSPATSVPQVASNVSPFQQQKTSVPQVTSTSSPFQFQQQQQSRGVTAQVTPTSSPLLQQQLNFTTPPVTIAQVAPNVSLGQQQQAAFAKPRPVVASAGNETEISQLRSMLQAQTGGRVQMPQMKQVEEVVETREEEQLRKGSIGSDGEKSGENYGRLALEVKKFQQRLDTFKRNQNVLQAQVEAKLVEVISKFEQEVVAGLNILQDFVEAVHRSTDTQTKDVNVLKEKVLSHFTDVEYAKSLNERNKDPKYIQLLQSQPMDPSTLQRFREIEKLFRYVSNQIREVERMSVEGKRDNGRPLEGSAAIQSIYQTLSNHSRIIKRLVQNLNDMRVQVGLCKCPDLDENMEVFEPTKSLGYGYFDKKPMLKGKPSDFNCTSNQKTNKHQTITPTYDRPSLDDLTAGMTKMNLEKERLRLPEKKSLRISAKKLDVLTKAVTKTLVIDVSRKEEEPAWDESKVSSASTSLTNKVEVQKKLISQIDDKTVPPPLKTKEQKKTVKIQSSQSKPSPIPVAKPSSAEDTEKSSQEPQVPSPTPVVSFTSGFGGGSLFGAPSGVITASSAPSFAASSAPSFAASSAPSFAASSAPSFAASSAPSFAASSAPSFAASSAPSFAASSAPSFAASSAPSFVASSAPSFAASSAPSFAASSAPSFAAISQTTSPAPLFSGLGLSTPTPSITKPSVSFSTTSLFTSVKESTPTVAATAAAAPSEQQVPFTFTSGFGGGSSLLGTPTGVSTASSAPSFAATLQTTSPAPLFSGLGLSTPTPLSKPSVSFSTTSLFTSVKESTPTVAAAAAEPQAPAPVASFTSGFGGGGSLFGAPSGVSTASNAPSFAATSQATSPAPLFSGLGISTPTPITKPSVSFGNTSSTSLFTSVKESGPAATAAAPSEPQAPAPVASFTSGFGGGGSLFGAPSGVSSPPPFAAAAQPTSPTSLFGGLGLSSPTPFTKPSVSFSNTSLFTSVKESTGGGAPEQQVPSISSTSIFGGGGGLFGAASGVSSPPPFAAAAQPTSPASVFGGGGVSSLAKPPATGGFGAPSVFGAAASPKQGFGSAPVFGGSPAFGSASPFGLAFGSSPGGPTSPSTVPAASSPFGGGSIFGGGGGSSMTSDFGALAHSAPPVQPQQSVFGGGFTGAQGGSVFGGGQQGSASVFGQPATQQASPFGGTPSPAKPAASFGGSAFSSWR